VAEEIEKTEESEANASEVEEKETEEAPEVETKKSKKNVPLHIQARRGLGLKKEEVLSFRVNPDDGSVTLVTTEGKKLKWSE